MCENGEDAEEAGEEYHAAAPEEVVEGIGEPGGEEPGDGGGAVYEAYEPGVVLDAELLWKGEVGSICACVVPALEGGAEGAEGDGIVEIFREVEFVGYFSAEMVFVVLV